MKRTSKTYVAYLEALALSLLAEREQAGKSGDIVGIDWQGNPVTYSPLNARTLIQTVRDTDLLG
jgi:hypothetical protein